MWQIDSFKKAKFVQMHLDYLIKREVLLILLLKILLSKLFPAFRERTVHKVLPGKQMVKFVLHCIFLDNFFSFLEK